jgi:hypothetical protein
MTLIINGKYGVMYDGEVADSFKIPSQHSFENNENYDEPHSRWPNSTSMAIRYFAVMFTCS